MFKVTRYCVQPYERRGADVMCGEPEQFYSMEEALRRATSSRRRLAGYEVYEVCGWPVQDLWDRPRLVSRAGVTLRPDGSLAGEEVAAAPPEREADASKDERRGAVVRFPIQSQDRARKRRCG